MKDSTKTSTIPEFQKAVNNGTATTADSAIVAFAKDTATKTRRNKKPTNVINFPARSLPVGCSSLVSTPKRWSKITKVEINDDALHPLHRIGDILPAARGFDLSDVTCSRIVIVYVKSLNKQIARYICNNGFSETVVLKAINPLYPSLTVEKDDIEIRGIILTKDEQKQYEKGAK